MPDGSVVRAQQLEDAKLRRDDGQAGAADLVPELIHSLEVNLGAQHFEAPLFHLPRHHLVAIGDVLGQQRNDVVLRLQLAPRDLARQLLSERARELLFLD